MADTSLWHQDAERSEPDFVVKRRIHDADFSINGYIDTRGSWLNPYFFRFESFELFIGIASQKGPQRNAHDISAAMARRRAHPQPAGIQRRSRTDLKTGRLVSVVADKQEGRHVLQCFDLVQVQLNAKAEIASHNRPQGKHERYLLHMSAALLFFPLTHEMRIEAHARIVHKHAAVDLADIHMSDFSGEEIPHRSFDVQRQPDIPGKMVQRPHRDNAQRGSGACQVSSHGIDRTVATTRDDRLAALADGTRGQGGNVVAALCNNHFRVGAVFARNTRDVLPRFLHMNRMAVEDADWAR